MSTTRITDHPLVSVVIHYHNGGECLLKCLDSVMKSSYENLEVILVDNASVGCKLALNQNETDPRFSIFRIPYDIGLAAGRNFGAARAKGDLILFLDEDVELGPLCIQQFVDAILEIHDLPIGAVGRSRFPGYNIDTIGNDLQVIEPDNIRTLENETREVFGLYGCTILVKKEAFHVTDGFDSDFFILLEDIDFCWRLHLAGYKILSLPGAKVVHHARNSHTVGKESHARYLTTKNRFVMLAKNYNAVNVLLFVPLTLIVTIAQIILLAPSKPEQAKACIEALAWTLTHSKRIMAKRLVTQRTRIISDKALVSACLIRKLDFSLLYNKFQHKTIQ